MRSLKLWRLAPEARRVSMPPPLRRLRRRPSSPRLRINCPMKYATSATAPAMHRSMISWSLIVLTYPALQLEVRGLHPHGGNLLDQEQPEEHEEAGDPDEDLALRGVEQKAATFGVEGVAQDEHDDGERHHDHAGEASFGGLGADALGEPQALADHAADVLEHFGQIATAG